VASDVAPGERDGPPEESDFSPDEELVDEFPVEPIPVMIDPKDGLPKPVDVQRAFAPPFTRTHIVCLEDKRSYVEIFYDETHEDNWVDRGSEGKDADTEYYSLPALFGDDWVTDRFSMRGSCDGNGQRRKRDEFKPDEVIEMWGVVCAKVAQDTFRPVRPIRPKCAHYKRQCFNNDEQPDPAEPGHRINFTHCIERRSIGGAFMSLRDQAIYACDHRDPPDEASRALHLDAFDEKRLREQGHKTKIPLFGMPGEDVTADESAD
jgi:hypothetical protein